MGACQNEGRTLLPSRPRLRILGDEAAHRLSLYRDGLLQGSAALSGQLSGRPDSSNWLGRSQYSGDPDFQGQLLDFRVYGTPLGASASALSQRLSPEADP